MLHRERGLPSHPCLCGGADSAPKLQRETHTNTELQEKLRGAEYSRCGAGQGAGGDPSAAVMEIMRSKCLKAHHKLSSIWEPLVLAGPTQRLQTRVKQR